MKKLEMPCNEDCFNCIFPDCILDGLGRPVKAAAKKEPKKIEPTKNRLKARAYYYAHLEEQQAKKKAYYYAHREELTAKKREKYRQMKAAKAAGGEE